MMWGGNMFVLKQHEDDLKLYSTDDDKFHVLERSDGIFLLYQLNAKDDCYDWTETYHDSLEQCEKEVGRLEQ